MRRTFHKRHPVLIFLSSIGFLILPFVIGCATVDTHSLLQPDPMELQPKISKLNFLKSNETVPISSASERAVNVNSQLYTLFERELDNISERTGETHGHIDITIILSEVQANYALAVFSGLTLMIPNFLGMPMVSGTAEVEYEVKIYNLNNDIIWKKIYYKKTSKAFTIYHGESWGDQRAINKHILLLYRELIVEMKNDLQKDVEKINDALKFTVLLEEGMITQDEYDKIKNRILESYS